MTVYFIGAGPGDPDLITVKGRKLVERCPGGVEAALGRGHAPTSGSWLWDARHRDGRRIADRTAVGIAAGDGRV